MRLFSSYVSTALFAALISTAAPVEAAGHSGGGVGFHGGGGFHGSGPSASVRAGGSFHNGHGRTVYVPGPRFRGYDGFRGGHFRGTFGYGFPFRPRFNVGFGVFLGYPFVYPSYAPWDWWSYPTGPLAYIPGGGYGGVSFAISPGNAGVTVDGAYAGTVDQFNSLQEPLNLPPGPHHVEIQAPGYAPLDFDVTVQAGQVTPYAGDLQQD
jgi:hypothetical protein